MATSFRTIDKPDYIPFAASKLVVGTKLPFEVYMKEGGMYKVLFDSGTDFNRLSHEFLVDKGLSELYVDSSDREYFDAYMAKGFIESDSILESDRAFKDYSFRKDKYYQIDRKMLLPGQKIPFTIYCSRNYAYKPVIEASAEQPAIITEGILGGAGDFLILQTDIPQYNDYLNSLLKADKLKGSEGQKIQAMLIKENSKIIVKDLFDNPRSGENIQKTSEMVNEMIDTITADKDTIYDLLSLRGYDYYTYTHSVNVGVLSVGLGIAAGLSKAKLGMLGIGAMLHDIGKSLIPAEIVNKQGKLDDMEYRIIQSHVTEGDNLLRQQHHLPEESLSAVSQHHEKMSGKGYPNKISRDQITVFGRITAIADCYDALTTTRPYRPSLTPFYALGVIAKETDNYDPELLKIFIKMLGKI